MTAAAAAQTAAVVYVDHANHLTPITLCYHATASRHLTSGRSDVIPPSTTTEIDSAYCPRSLEFCDAATASSRLGRGSYKDCPVCFWPAAVSIDENTSDPSSTVGRLVCHYLCDLCQWSSRECGVTSNADELLGYSTSEVLDALKEKEAAKKRAQIIEKVSEELELCLERRIKETNEDGDSLFNSILGMWARREQDEQRRKRLMMGTSSFKSGTDTGDGIWSLETLEQSLLEKKKELDSPYILGNGEKEAEKTENPAEDTPMKGKELPTPQQMAAQMPLTTRTPQSRSDLFPLPVYYRARLSRRCRAELASGRTGILIKPKLNPLEGDSSLRAGHGQWWKKDSSAVHVVPRVQVCRHGADPASRKHAALLKVKNPTLTMIRLRLGQFLPKDEGGDGDAAASSPLIDQSELQNILVDPFTEKFVQARLCAPEAASAVAPTEFFVLDPADDPYLDIGKGLEDDPPGVKDWDAAILLGASGHGGAPRLRVIAAQGDSAWIELTMRDSAEGNPPGYLAVPLALQIEVGNGSWEASLIKRRDLPEGERDLVALNLVVLLG